MLRALEVEAAVAAADLRSLAEHVAEMALDSARENGAKPYREHAEAAERVDELGLGRAPHLHELMACEALQHLDASDTQRVARLAIAILEGRA